MLHYMQLALFSTLCNEVLRRRAAKMYNPESLALAATLLEQNPEMYTVWNYRREAIGRRLQVGLFLQKHINSVWPLWPLEEDLLQAMTGAVGGGGPVRKTDVKTIAVNTLSSTWVKTILGA